MKDLKFGFVAESNKFNNVGCNPTTRATRKPSLKATNQKCYGTNARPIIRSHNFLDKKPSRSNSARNRRRIVCDIGGISNNNNSKLLAANGTKNHVHLLVSMSKNIELSELVGGIKRDS